MDALGGIFFARVGQAAHALHLQGGGGGDGRQHLHVKLEEEQVVITMAVLMAYGHTIPEMGKAVQEAVKNAWGPALRRL